MTGTFAVRAFTTEHAKDLDLDGSSVSTTRCGYVKQLPGIARMAEHLGIRWCPAKDRIRVCAGN